MNYPNAFFGLCCFSVIAMQAMHQSLINDPMPELQKILQFNRANTCSIRHRSAYDEWMRRQNIKERAINEIEVPSLLTSFGFSALPPKTSDVDRRVNDILSNFIFCDQIYKDQQAQETIRALARYIIIAGEILKGAITNRPRIVPTLDKDNLLFTPLSTLASVLVNYVINNVPDIDSAQVNQVQALINQLLRQADKTEPKAKDIRTQAAQDLATYIRQTAPLLYESDSAKGANRLPTEEEYKYAMQLLSQNKRLTIPKKPSAAIEAWRIQASDFLKSTDYQPERYKDPEIAHLVKSMVEDINSAAAIIKAHLQKKPTQANIKKPSVVDPRVHARIKEIIKAIDSPEIAPEEQKDLVAVLTEQKAKIGQLPAEYQDALKQYFNIDERIERSRGTSATQPPPVAPETKPAQTPAEQKPAELTPVSIAAPAPVPTQAAPPTEQKPPEPAAPATAPAPAPAELPPAPSEEIKPVGLEKAPTTSATTPATPTASTTTGQAAVTPAAEVKPATTAGTPSEGGAGPTTSLKEQLEQQGAITEVAVGTKPTTPAATPTTPTTPAKSSASSSTPAAKAVESTGTPVVSPTISTGTEAFVTPSTPTGTETPPVTTPTAPETTPAAAETPTTPSTPSIPSTPAAPTQPTGQSGKEVSDSLQELQDQLKRINTRS